MKNCTNEHATSYKGKIYLKTRNLKSIVCQCHFGTIPLLLGNDCASLAWERLCQPHLGTIVVIPHGINCVSVTWEQLCQFRMGTIVPVSLGNNCVSLTWEQSYQSYLETIHFATIFHSAVRVRQNTLFLRMGIVTTYFGR